MRVLALLALCFAAVAAAPNNPQRIVGGSATTIDQYPIIVALLYSRDLNTFWQVCGGTILNNRAILTAAHCTSWRIRVGSSFGNSGGVVHNVKKNIVHSLFSSVTFDNDIAILHSATTISFNNNVRAGSIAGPDYHFADYQPVWAVGWGTTVNGGSSSEQLRHALLTAYSQNACRYKYALYSIVITDNMVCSGWPDGSRDQCQGDSGGPLLHNNNVIGICSFGIRCGQYKVPGVNLRVSRYTTWIIANS
ncbi:hypothetical protein B5X24_HaOG200448 [Helicoverpa armigera]|uniref:Peptidase S1 domain-containing protein n=1 Tax=Helicoverpa armigera TaxID=29058 RepID=A0A2W1BIB7_HELAM|nr:hypothetical protein B5X24_HaOG200448 [Helicoverpa armigera]